MKRYLLVLALIGLGLTGPLNHRLTAAEPPAHLLIYQNSQALVSQERTFQIEPNTLILAWPEVTGRIDPTSACLDFLWLNSQATEVLEQTYSYDLASRASLLKKYLGQTVTVINPKTGESRSYKLLTAEDDPVLLDKNGQVHLATASEIVLPALPQGLSAKPTLVFKIKNLTAGEKKIRLSYLSGGFDWQADYAAALDEAGGTLALTCAASVNNESGLDFNQAQVGLIAGNPNQVYRSSYKNAMMAEALPAAPAGDSSAPAFEYHLFALPGPTDLPNNQTKQITLFARGPVPMAKIYRVAFSSYYYSRGKVKQPVAVQVKFKNSATGNLGLVMPAGTVRFYQDSGGRRMFLGEDSLGQTPVDEEVLLDVGQAFDLTAEKEKLSQNIVGSQLTEDQYKIALRSQKDKKVEIELIQQLAGNQKLTKSSLKPVSQADQQIKWLVPVEKKGAAEVTFTVQTVTK